MNIERLTQLARVVREAPDHRFHMRTFREETICGTAYCAAGWAFIDPWFEADGFKNIWTIRSEGIWATENALAFYFDLSNRDANRLFALDIGRYEDPHAVSKAEVLANIDRILGGLSAEPYNAVVELEGEDLDDEGEDL